MKKKIVSYVQFGVKTFTGNDIPMLKITPMRLNLDDYLAFGALFLLLFAFNLFVLRI